MRKTTIKETVLYYTPENNMHVTKLKGVLVRMGIRIKNVGADQVTVTVGGLLGLPGCTTEKEPPGTLDTLEEIPLITEEVLVMHNFSGSRLDELLLNLRKAGVPKINLKAVVTESNAGWSFYHLYEEIKEEHEKMREKES